MKKQLDSNTIIWIIYIALLAGLLRHTAWAFAKFEPTGDMIDTFLAWALAFVFECALAVFTYKLAGHIEQVPNIKDKWRRFNARYLNAYGLGLFVLWGVSTLANLSHSVEFGQRLKILDDWSIPFSLYAIAFGAILPLVSLLFARVLSNAIEAEHETDPEVTRLNTTVRELSRKLRETEQQRNEAEQRFTVLGDVLVRLSSERAADRIIAVHERWPQLPVRSKAIIADVSPSYVSEVLNGSEVE